MIGSLATAYCRYNYRRRPRLDPPIVESLDSLSKAKESVRYTIRGFLKPRLFEMREAVLRDEESHDVIIQFKSGLLWLRPMICGSHPKQRRLELKN